MIDHRIGHGLALEDLDVLRRKLEAAIIGNDYSSIRGLVIDFDATPALMVSAPHIPEVTFNGRVLQDLNDLDRLMDVQTFTMVGTGDNRGMAAFSWVGDEPAAQAFCESITALAPSNLPNRLIQFAFEHFENVFWSPNWWESRSDLDKSRMIARMNSGLYEAGSFERLNDDGTRSAEWGVCGFRWY